MQRLENSDIVLQGLARVNKGEFPTPVARQLLSNWGQIAITVRRQLAEIGLSTMISDAVLHQRKQTENARRRAQRRKSLAEAKTKLAAYNLTIKKGHRLHLRSKCVPLAEEERYNSPPARRHAMHECVIASLGEVLTTGNRDSITKAVKALAARNCTLKAKIEAYEKIPVQDRVARLIQEAIQNSLRSVVLACSDGMRTLFDFRAVDAQAWVGKARSHSDGWARRAEWFGLALAAMSKAKVSAISDLATRDLRRLAHEADIVWKEAAMKHLRKAHKRPTFTLHQTIEAT